MVNAKIMYCSFSRRYFDIPTRIIREILLETRPLPWRGRMLIGGLEQRYLVEINTQNVGSRLFTGAIVASSLIFFGLSSSLKSD